MYPKVKVRVHEEEDDLSPQNDHRAFLLTNVSEVKQTQSCSLPLIDKTMKAYVPKLAGQSISSSTEGKNRHLGKANRPIVRACSVLRPRAVLSSPENDGMIGSRNKLTDKKSSAFRVHSTKERVPAQTKIAPSQVKATRPMNMTKVSNKAFINKNGLVQRRVQKPMIPKQEANLGIGKSSFT